MWRFRNSAIVVALLFLSSTEAAASKSCPTRAEAKAVHRGAYLYWHRNSNGQRCWSTRRVKSAPHAARRAAPIEEEEKAPTKPPPVQTYYPQILRFPPDQPPIPLPSELTRQQSIFDFVPWSSDAYAATPGPQVLPPPPLPTPVNRETKGDKQGRSTVTVDMIMVMVTFWLLIVMVGMTLYRWMKQRNALRISWMLALLVLAGCSHNVERFDSQPRSWTKTYEPGGKP